VNPPRPRDLLVATGNMGKVREIAALLRPFGLDMVSLDQLAAPPAMPEETGHSYRENALLKAQVVAVATRRLVLADDSGLEVDCLGGRPGLYSARYGTSDGVRVQRLLDEIGQERLPARARFVCVAALAMPDGRNRCFTGRCLGNIVSSRVGTNGFGFDPVFLVDGHEATMAELSMESKNEVSHRARAVKSVAAFLCSSSGMAWQGKKLV